MTPYGSTNVSITGSGDDLLHVQHEATTWTGNGISVNEALN